MARPAPGRDEVGLSLATFAAWSRGQGQALYWQALELRKSPCRQPLAASAERGGGGWRRGLPSSLPRSRGRRSAAPAPRRRRRLEGMAGRARRHPENGSGPRPGPRAVSPAQDAQRPYLKRRRKARSRASSHAAAEPRCCAQPRLPKEARPCFSRRFPLGVSATASDNSGAVYTVGPRTPPPPPLPPFLHPSAVADSAAATSSAAASSLWSIFQPPNPEKQETPTAPAGNSPATARGTRRSEHRRLFRHWAAAAQLLLRPPSPHLAFPRP